MRRFFVALILTPLISSLLFGIFEAIASGQIPNYKLIFNMLPIFSIFTGLGLIVFGLPTYYLFKKLDILNLVNLTLAGGLMGIIYMFLFHFVITSTNSSIEILEVFSWFIMGAMSALIFGILAGISSSKN